LSQLTKATAYELLVHILNRTLVKAKSDNTFASRVLSPDSLCLAERGLEITCKHVGVSSVNTLACRKVVIYVVPAIDRALSVIDADDGRESGTVYAEERRGYLMNGELLRPARVVVLR
jgi:hypothetical protein